MPAKRKSNKSLIKRQAAKRAAPKNFKRIPAAKLTKAAQRNPNNLRKAFTQLRKLGLVTSKRNVKKIKGGDKKVASLISKFKDVLTGKSDVIPLPPKEAAKYKKQGRRIEKGNLIVKKVPGVKRKRKGKRVFTVQEIDGGEIISLVIPTSLENLEATLEELENDPEILALKKKGWRYAFRYYGHYSLATFADIDLLLEYLQHYKSMDEALSRKFMQLELVFVSRTFKRPDLRGKTSYDKKREARFNRRYGHSYSTEQRQKLKRRNPTRAAALARKEAERQRKYRAKIRQSKTKREAYRSAARDRARQSWRRSKKK